MNEFNFDSQLITEVTMRCCISCWSDFSSSFFFQQLKSCLLIFDLL